MTTLKRINQETFDEVVRENMEEFDMPIEQAIQDACDQFTKQGVDLTILDLSGGAGKEEFLESIKKFQQLTQHLNVDNSFELKNAIVEIMKYMDEKCDHMKRNLRLFQSSGGYSTLHSLFKENTPTDILLSVIESIKKMSKSNLDIRDAFEPDGSKNLCAILDKQLRSEIIDTSVMETCLSLAKIVTKTENTKVFLMRYGIGNIIASIITRSQQENKNDTNSTNISSNKIQGEWDNILKEVCYVIKGLCIHDDIRREMSCAYDNGRFFNNSPVIAPTLMKLASLFQENESLASSALSAARSLITTEESVKIMAQNGAMNLPKAILGFQTATIELVRSVLGLMRNLCADDIRKEKLIGDGSLQLLIQVLSSEKYSSDMLLVEHGLACLAAMSLRSPGNSTKIVHFGTIEIVVRCMRKHSEKTPLQRQGCLLIRNIAGRCPELRGILLDAGVENILRSAGRFQDCVDEAYGALRDLECEVQRVKITEDGKIEAAYEQFGATTIGKKFNPVFEETYELSKRVQEEARAPFADSNYDNEDYDDDNANNGCCDNDHNHDHSH